MTEHARRTQTKAIGVGQAVAFVFTLLCAGGDARAVLDQPDALFYGRVFASGGPAGNGVVVSARSGTQVIDSYVLGSDSTTPDFYTLSIPMAQATEDGEAPPTGSVFSGSPVFLFIGSRAAGEVTARSGGIVRRELTSGPSLCSGGTADRQSCTIDANCPGGLCIVAQALCDGGTDDGMRCECIGSTCGGEPACASNGAMGTCGGGAIAGECCSPSMNCDGGSGCAASARLCQGGARKGFPCLRDAHCPGSSCASTGRVCNGGGQAGFSCVDDGDCAGGVCGARLATPTPTVTPTGGGGATPTPTPTPTPGLCAGDCDSSGIVSVDELVTLVDESMSGEPIAICPRGDLDGDTILELHELVAAVSSALRGCAR